MSVKLSPADLEKLQTKQVANVIRKLHEGKTLTGREQTLLAKAGAGGGEDACFDSVGNYASTWDELATACGIDRRTLTNVRSRHAKHPGLPQDRADGRKEVAAWIKFLDDIGCRGRGVNNPDIDYLDERHLRLRREKVQLDKAEFELEKAKQMSLPVSDFETALSITVGAFNASLNAMPGRAAAKIIARARAAILAAVESVLTHKQCEKIEAALNASQIDYADIEEVLRAEVDVAKRALATCEYLKSTGAQDSNS